MRESITTPIVASIVRRLPRPALAGALAVALALLVPNAGTGQDRTPACADRPRASGAAGNGGEDFEALVEAAPSPIVVTRPATGRIAYANRRALELMGVERGALEETCVWEWYVDPKDRARLLARLEAEGAVPEFETRIRLPDGRVRWASLEAGPATFRGEPALVVSFRDVTGWKETEAALRLSRRHLARIMDAVPVMMACLDADERHIVVNQAYADWFGQPITRLLGRKAVESLGTGHYERFAPLYRRALAGETIRFEDRVLDRQGRERYLYATLLPHREPAGEVSSFFVVLCDTTTRRRHEEALRQANARLNLLSTVTRHDIRNQLTALFGRLDLAAEAGDREEQEREIRRVRANAEAIWTMIEFAHDYEHVGLDGAAWFRLEETMEEAVRELGEGRLAVEAAPAGLECYVDPLFPKVVYNLVENAARYGASAIRFEDREEGDGRLALVVEDDGCGVPAHEKALIFEQGYGKNTGLGLYLAREILGITGCTIVEDGAPGEGARFTLVFPPGAWRRG